jgi:hypothetical protein
LDFAFQGGEAKKARPAMAGLFTLLEAEGFRNYTSKDVRMMNGRSEGSSAFFYAGRPIDRPTNELPKLRPGAMPGLSHLGIEA